MKILKYICLACWILCARMEAVITVVTEGETVTSTVTVVNPGDEALVQEGGAIVVAAGDGVVMQNNNQTTVNNGLIDAGNDGVQVADNINNAQVINNGLIDAGGEGVFIGNTSTNAQVTNTGVIQAALNGVGVEFSSENAQVTNNGTIEAGNDGVFISSDSTNAQVTNNGTIDAIQSGVFISFSSTNANVTNNGFIDTIQDGVVFFNSSANAQVTNNGVIQTAVNRDGIKIGTDNTFTITNARVTNNGLIDAGRDGILIFESTDTQVTNTGVIDAERDGILLGGNSENAHVINSGTIIGKTNALDLNGTNTQLTLLRGSNLQGAVIANNPLNMSVETGLNLALTLGAGSFGSLEIEAPFVLMDNILAVVDPTGLALQSDVLADLSDSVLNGIYHHRNVCWNSCGCGLWAQGIGSYRSRSHQRDSVGYANWQGGFLIGYDRSILCSNLAVFGGAVFGEAEVDANTQTAELSTALAGLVYEKNLCSRFIGVAVAAGYVNWCNTRFVMNNLAGEGVEAAKTTIHGAFVSPEISFEQRFSCGICSPNLDLTVRYAGLFLGDYKEEGSLTNLAVKNRHVDLITTRLAVGLPMVRKGCRWCSNIEPFIGGFARCQVGGNRIEGELLEQALNFEVGEKNIAAFMCGFRGAQSLGKIQFSINMEASFDSCKSSRVIGEAGFGWSF